MFLQMAACQGPEPSKAKVPSYFDWMIGEWKQETPDGVLTEIWIRANDSLLLGESFFVTGQDTPFSERIRIEKRMADYFYIVLIANQNGGMPVEFRLVQNSSALVFENLNHDFPNRIVYRDSIGQFLVASIEGKRNGQPAREEIILQRVK